MLVRLGFIGICLLSFDALSFAQSNDLQVYPDEIKLDGPHAQQHLVVLAKQRDGNVRELSLTAQVAIADPKVAAFHNGIVSPIGDGKTTLTITIGTTKKSVPVTVAKA